MCLIRSPRSSHPVKAEVVGFRDGDVLLMPLGELVNVGPDKAEDRTHRKLPYGKSRRRPSWPRSKWSGRAYGCGN